MLALSIRQPFAELIPSASSGQALRGIKTVEYRSRPTRVIGRRFHIYASKTAAQKAIWSRDLAVPPPGEALPAPPLWMIELAEQVGMIEPGALALLPRGVIVGSAVIEKVSRVDDVYAWHLAAFEARPSSASPPGGRSRSVSIPSDPLAPPLARASVRIGDIIAGCKACLTGSSGSVPSPRRWSRRCSRGR